MKKVTIEALLPPISISISIISIVFVFVMIRTDESCVGWNISCSAGVSSCSYCEAVQCADGRYRHLYFNPFPQRHYNQQSIKSVKITKAVISTVLKIYSRVRFKPELPWL